MRLSLAQAIFVCSGLVACDLAARALRLRLLLAGLGFRVTFWEALRIDCSGDAACALTPGRIGGEPTRVTAMMRVGVPATAAAVLIGFEVATVWPLIAALLAGLGASSGVGWWRLVAPRVIAFAHATRFYWFAAVALSLLAAWFARRLAPRGLMRRALRARAYSRRMPAWRLAATIPLTLATLGARVAVLPVLAATLPLPPPIGATALGSFILLYGQLVVATPSGAGLVDLGLLGGVAGDFGVQGAQLLFFWRIFTSGVGFTLGVILGLKLLGATILARLRGTRAPVTDEPPARHGSATAVINAPEA